MKRVLMTADTLGGVWNYSLELMRALPEIEFAFCTMGAPLSRSQNDELAATENVRLFASSYQLEWMDNPWRDVDAAGEWLLDIAAKFQPEVIHLSGYSHPALEWNAPVIVVAHSCVLSWWRAVKRENAPARFGEYRDRVTAGLDAADVVIAPTRAMLAALRENYDANFTDRIIYNGCDSSRFVTPPAHALCHPERREGPHKRDNSTQTGLCDPTAGERSFASLRMTGSNSRPVASADAAAKQPKILAAGRVWDEAKNLRALDAVASSVQWPIEIAGELCAPGGELVSLQSARSLGNLNRTQLAFAMASAAVFAAPARYEPFGLSILEAALSGCALVLGDIPSLRELWNDAAIFINPADHAALLHALNRLSRDADLRLDLSRRARERALNFPVEKMAASYRELYSSCAQMEAAA